MNTDDPKQAYYALCEQNRRMHIWWNVVWIALAAVGCVMFFSILQGSKPQEPLRPVTLSFTFNNITSQKAKELTDAVTERLVQRGILPPFKEVRR